MINLQEILNLSIAERILMVEKIWNSIEHDKQPISVSHQQELNKRLERFEQGKTKFYSWEDIKVDLHKSQ